MKYRVLDGLDLDNRAYVAGDTVAIDDDAIVAALMDDGVIEASEAPPDQEGGKAAVEDGEAPPDQEGVDRIARLMAAIGDLASDNPELWTSSGKPRTEALEAVSDLDDVSAAERDAAWDAHLRGQDGSGAGGT